MIYRVKNLKRKNIVFVVSSPITAKVFLKSHFQSLDSVYDIILISNFSNWDLKVFKDHKIKRFINLPFRRNFNIIYDIICVFKLTYFFIVNDIYSVHSITPKSGLITSIASNLAFVKFRIHTFTGQVWATKKGPIRWFLKLMDKIISKNCSHILIDGESQRQFLVNNKIISKSNCRVLGKGSISGVDLDKFKSNVIIRKKIRKKLKISDEDVVYTYIGRLKFEKGIIELSEAFNKLLNKYENIKLIIVGQDEENIEKKINENISSDKIIFTGMRNDPENYLQACDIFCMPSHREGFGTAIIEASSMKKPIICSNIYGLRQTIIENKTGLFFEVKNSRQLYEKMEELYLNPNYRTILGRNGRKYVKKNFSNEQISKEWFNFYKFLK